MISLQRKTFARGIFRVVLGAGPMLVATQSLAMDSQSRMLSFASNSYEMVASDATIIKALADRVKTGPRIFLVIQENTAALKTSSLAYIIEKNRALRIFQALVRLGVDPARIISRPVRGAPGKGVVVSWEEGAEKATAQILPAATPASADNEFTINFPTASAVPSNLSEERFRGFLSSVGQPGRDAVVIEGFTDTMGNVVYNQALGELRALFVYEKLVRAGLPPYRVSTESKGMHAAKKQGDAAEERKVVIRWTRNETIAATAAKEEAATPPPAPVKQEKEVAPATPAPAPVKQEKEVAPATTFDFDLVPYAGLMLPQGDLRDNAKNATTFGLGIGKALKTEGGNEVRGTLYLSSRSKHEAKESDRSGPLYVRSLGFRFDYAWALGFVQPFVGAGLGSYTWQGSIVQPSTGLQNTGDRSDWGGTLAGGVDLVLMPRLFLSPVITYHSVGGDFAEPLVSTVVELRWRI